MSPTVSNILTEALRNFNVFKRRNICATAGLLFWLCSFPPVRAQILLGPTAGVHMGWVNFNNKDNRELYTSRPSVGFHAGGSLAFRMKSKVFLQTSVLYAQKEKNLVGRKDKMLHNKARYSYIDMPISFTKEVKMRIGKSKYYNLYFGAGPTIGYWLGGRGRLTASDLNENLINPPDYKLKYKVKFDNSPGEIPLGTMNVKDANRFQLGLNFAAGVVFEPITAQKVMFTVRYELGHSYFSQYEDGDFGLAGVLFYEEDMQARNQSIGCSLFYFIDLKTEERNKGRSTSKIRKK